MWYIIDMHAKAFMSSFQPIRLLRVLELEPTNGNATFCLGLVYFDLNDLSQAEDRFLQALDMSPGHPGTLYNLGVVLSQQER